MQHQSQENKQTIRINRRHASVKWECFVCQQHGRPGEIHRERDAKEGDRILFGGGSLSFLLWRADTVNVRVCSLLRVFRMNVPTAVVVSP